MKFKTYSILTCNRYSQEQSQEQEPVKEAVLPATATEPEPEPVKDQMILSSKLEAIEQKLMKLQSLKDETINEFSSLLSESTAKLVVIISL